MNFLLQPPPDTSGYMIAGYVVIFGVMLLYLISLVVRNRNLKADLDVLNEMQNEGEKLKASQAGQEGRPAARPQTH